MPEPSDTGPQTEPSLEARPDPTEEPSEPLPIPARPAPASGGYPHVVTGQYHSLKRWALALMPVAVWIPAAAIGVGLYYWWFHSFDKTRPVFVVLVFVVVCSVAAMLAAMTDSKPLVAAAAIALMAAPMAAVAAAAVLHGMYYCDRVTSPCLVGVLPY
ncbi:MAG TPA: hypothetical protein VLU24_11335 [Mycobacterium sp.]|nr:hypothetical protein [Mycobacterium sp.]